MWQPFERLFNLCWGINIVAFSSAGIIRIRFCGSRALALSSQPDLTGSPCKTDLALTLARFLIEYSQPVGCCQAEANPTSTPLRKR